MKLRDLLLELDLDGYDLTATGFSSQEVEDLCIRLDEDLEAEEDEFDIDSALEEITEPTTRKEICG